MNVPRVPGNRPWAFGGMPLVVFGLLATNLAHGLPPGKTIDCAPVAASMPMESTYGAVAPIVAPPPLTPAARQACSIDVENFLRERARLLAIDVRDAGQAGRVGLSGAPILSIEQLAGKRFLRDQAVVLAGDGLDDTVLFRVCQQLRQVGGNVRVLTGGIRALNRAGGRGVDGNDEMLADYDWLLPADWHRFALHAPDRLVLLGVTSPSRSPGVDRALRWSVSDDWSIMAGRLRVLADAVPDMALAVATANREQAAALQAALRRAGVGNVYVLRDGWSAYEDYLDQQRRIAANAHRTLRHPCGSV